MTVPQVMEMAGMAGVAKGRADAGPVLVDARALARIEEEVLARYVEDGHETGGLLVGPTGTRVVLDFLPSGASAVRSTVTFRSDPVELQGALDAAFAAHGFDVLGYVHSHPPRSPDPSGRDLEEAASMLADPDYHSLVDEVLLPIATVYVDRSGEDRHVVQLDWYVYHREDGLSSVTARVIPHWAAVSSLERELASKGWQIDTRSLADDGIALVATDGPDRFVFVLPPTFPASRPQIFRLDGDTPVEEVAIESMEAAVEWLARAESPQSPPSPPSPRPTRLESEPETMRVIATDAAWSAITASGVQPLPARAVEQGDGRRTWIVDPVGPPSPFAWRETDAGAVATHEGGASVEIERFRFEADFASRSAGLVEPSHLGRAHVIVVGCGSVGSAMASGFVRAGIGGLTLVDPDEVSIANLCRSDFELADVGRQKAAALADRCRRINPHVCVDVRAIDFTTLGADGMRAMGRRAALAVVAVDRPDVVRVANLYLHRLVPCVYPGIYAGGSGGEVLFTRPPASSGDRPPCLECVLREVRFGADPPSRGRWNYRDDGRLEAEPALGAQIGHVVSAAVVISLALVSRPGDGRLGRLLDPRYSGVFLANEPGWIFEHPFQAVWAEFEAAADCQCRGDEAEGAAT